MTDIQDDDGQGQFRAELRAHKRERILETATRLFYEGGYRATSMESIADELSATKPFIYYHFRNKYDILEEIAMRVIRLAREAFDAAERQGGSAGEVLANLVRNYARLVMEQQRIVAVFWREESNFNAATRSKVVAEQQALVRVLAGLLERGAKEGIFTVTEPRLTALSILNMVTFTYTWYREDGNLGSDKLAEHFVALVARMVGG